MRLLVSGVLHKDPQQRQSKTGATYTTATIKDDTTDTVAWISATAFGDQAEILAKLQAGDGVGLSGKATIGTYTPQGGNTRPNICMTVDQISTLKKNRSTTRQSQPDHQAGGPIRSARASMKNENPARNTVNAETLEKAKEKREAGKQQPVTDGTCQQCGLTVGADGHCPQCPF